MEPAPLEVSPEMSVRDLAMSLIEGGFDGACVVDDDRLVGVVTSMDLVFKEKKLHIPSFFTFLDVVIPLESMSSVKEELDKISGVTVREIMSTDPATIAPDATSSEAATTMVDHHYTILPVVEDGKLVGVVTKRGLVRAAYGM